MSKLKTLSRAAIRGRLTRFERSVRAHEMRGSQHPLDSAAIERYYRAERENLERWIIDLALAGFCETDAR